MRICPAGAIKAKPMEIGRIETGKSGDIEFVSGELKIGHVRTPAMVREVKKSIRPDAFSVIDTAPGTSCEVVETLKGVEYVLLVTEPTPFGLHDLKLAVELTKKMNLPFGVLLNRCDIGNNDVEKYCEEDSIDILMKLPDDIRIAECYSTGQMIVEVLSEYKKEFSELYEYIQSVKPGNYDKRGL
jgi:MinD superfamily P-loop ATPase